jgi:hypothetical protein
MISAASCPPPVVSQALHRPHAPEHFDVVNGLHGGDQRLHACFRLPESVLGHGNRTLSKMR